MTHRRYVVIFGKSSSKVACLRGVGLDAVVVQTMLSGNPQAARLLEQKLPTMAASDIVYVIDETVFIEKGVHLNAGAVDLIILIIAETEKD